MWNFDIICMIKCWCRHGYKNMNIAQYFVTTFTAKMIFLCYLLPSNIYISSTHNTYSEKSTYCNDCGKDWIGLLIMWISPLRTLWSGPFYMVDKTNSVLVKFIRMYLKLQLYNYGIYYTCTLFFVDIADNLTYINFCIFD